MKRSRRGPVAGRGRGLQGLQSAIPRPAGGKSSLEYSQMKDEGRQRSGPMATAGAIMLGPGCGPHPVWLADSDGALVVAFFFFVLDLVMGVFSLGAALVIRLFAAFFSWMAGAFLPLGLRRG